MNELAELARLGSATVYEAAGRRGCIDVDLHQIVPGSRVAGPARTVRCGQDDNLMVHAVIERIESGDVVVLTMPQPRAVALVGELLATQAQMAGAAGLLVDASVRDVEELAQLGLPIWARWVRVRGATKTEIGELDVAVTVGGASIGPGDVVVLDANGGVVVEARSFTTVLAASLEREDSERVKRERLAAGERSYDLDGLRAVVEGA